MRPMVLVAPAAAASATVSSHRDMRYGRLKAAFAFLAAGWIGWYCVGPLRLLWDGAEKAGRAPADRR